jgi:hypothetical protein
MSTPDVKNPGALSLRISGVELPSERAAEVGAGKAQTSTGIANLNVHTPEGRSQVEKALLDLGLAMPQFLTGSEGKAAASLSDESLAELGSLGKIAAGLTVPNAEVTRASADLQGRWANLIANQKINGTVDVNSLVQYVLREAYMENTKDLHFYGQKVRFYNSLKKMIREELTKAREYLAEQAGRESEEELVGGTYANSVGGTGPLSFPTEPHFDEETGAMVPHEPQASSIDFSNKEHLETYIQNLEEQLNSVGDDAQLANVDLQNMLQKQQQTLQMMSNISKMLHDTAMAIIRKIGS